MNDTLKKLYPHNKYLWCYDAAYDNKELIAYHNANNHDYIIRHNIKKRPIQFIVDHARDNNSNSQIIKKNKDITVYRGSIDLEYDTHPVRLVYELSLLRSDKDQGLLYERAIQFSVLTNIKDLSDEEILILYRTRGTCEQYISELKTDLDLERLPSGKFDVNKIYFQLGIFANNILRIIGESLIPNTLVKLGKATRRRIRTILQGIMYMCGKLVRHARKLILMIVDNFGFGDALIFDIERFRRL